MQKNWQYTENFRIGNNHGIYPTIDHGPFPYVFNIRQQALRNRAFRSTVWTGKHQQLTLMNIPVGGEIGLENHSENDQFIRIISGQALVQMGTRKDQLHYRKNINSDDAVIIPAGTWHNITNTGRTPLKLYSLYAPFAHPKGTVHLTKNDADEAES